MPFTSKRTAAALTVATILTATSTATPVAAATSCKPTPNHLAHRPTVIKLDAGATARVWDTGATPASPQAATRIVAVEVPASSAAKPRVRAAATLSSAKTPSRYLTGARSAVVMVNGGVFNPASGALPDLPQMTAGHLDKARSVHDPAIVITKDGTSSPSRIWVVGFASSPGKGSKPVTGVNWQSVTGSGVNVYTPAWGGGRRPAGTVDVVLSVGKVAAVRTGTARGQAPTAGQTILTGTGATGAWLAKLSRGASVSVAYHAETDAKHTPFEAVGRGARFLNRGVKNGGTCAARDELLRPRTAVGWTKSGNLLVVTVSGRATIAGVRYGGATIHQMADYMARLGSYDATNLDGGGSTTMLVRTPTGKVLRMDRPIGQVQRPVPNVFSAG